jgi:hypothetical protein
MTGPIRVAGWGTGPDATVVTWTVAEGGKGRRWREVIARGPDVVHSLLYETDPTGRFSHLELARGDGLWTFHPEGDGTLHGNHVAPAGGIRHISGLPFGPDHVLLVQGSIINAAAIGWRHATNEGALAEVAGVVVTRDGQLEERPEIRVARLADGRWRVGEERAVEIDGAGTPVFDDGQTWPLELD